MENRAGYYLQTYGLVPGFKASLNLGKVTVAEVGEVKTEIAYHGDTLNTASRVLELCHKYGENLLFTANLADCLPPENPPVEEIDRVTLRGKVQPVIVYRFATDVALKKDLKLTTIKGV